MGQNLTNELDVSRHKPLRALFVPKAWMLLIPILLFYGPFYIYPLFKLMSLSVFDPDFTLRHFRHFFVNPAYLKVLINTISMSLTVTLLCLFLGYPTAYFLANINSRAANLLMIAVILPYFTSIMVRTFSWIILLGREGIVNKLLLSGGLIQDPIKMIFNGFGVHVGMVHFLLPYAILIIHSVMKNIDSNLMRSSESLGASRIQTFLFIYFPLTLPGVVGGGILIFIIALGFFVTPALLGGLNETMLAQFIEIQVHETVNWGFASTLALVLLVTTMFIFLISSRFLNLNKIWGGELVEDTPMVKKNGASMETDSSHPSFLKNLMNLINKGLNLLVPVSTVKKYIDLIARVITRGLRVELTLGRLDIGKIVIGLVGVLVLSYLLFPVLINFPISISPSQYFDFPPTGFTFTWYENYLFSEDWMNATLFSIKVAVLTAVFSVFMGVMTSMGIVRSKFKAKQMVYMFLLSPVIVPVIIIALGSYFLMAQLHLVGTAVGIALAHSIVIIPITIVVITSNLAGFDIRLEQAAVSLGAGRLRTFFTITFPIIRPGVIIATLFAFIYSFDEVVISMFLSGIEGTTLPVMIWDTIREDINPTISAICSVLVLATCLLLMSAGLLKKRLKH
jgi:putative spermidine/putrescine transport system permease protein